MVNSLSETYKNSVMPHGRHIYVTASDMVMAKMCSYPPSQHELPHWKCVLHWCANCPCIDLPDQESDMYRSNTSPSINFHIYHLVERCTVHGRLPIDEHYFLFVFTEYGYYVTWKIIHQKRDCYDGDIYFWFRTSFYIPEIKKLEFHPPHTCILGTDHCGNTCCEAFKNSFIFIT